MDSESKSGDSSVSYRVIRREIYKAIPSSTLHASAAPDYIPLDVDDDTEPPVEKTYSILPACARKPIVKFDSFMLQFYKGRAMLAKIDEIPTLDGTNFEKWKEQLMNVLACIELDYAFRVEQPAELSSSSCTEEHKAAYNKWERANRLSLMIMKKSVTESFRSGILEDKDARRFLKLIEERVAINEKTEKINVLRELVSMRYNGEGKIDEYIMEMNKLVTRLRALKLDISDDFFMNLVLVSLPAQFANLLDYYCNSLEKWSKCEFFTRCVAEDEKLQREKANSVNLARASQYRKRKRTKNTKIADLEVQKNQNISVTCFFCRGAGHLKRQCSKYICWRQKKDLLKKSKKK